MMELVDVSDLKSAVRNSVPVRVRLAAPQSPFEMINKGWMVDYNIGEEKEYLHGAMVLRY